MYSKAFKEMWKNTLVYLKKKYPTYPILSNGYPTWKKIPHIPHQNEMGYPHNPHTPHTGSAEGPGHYPDFSKCISICVAMFNFAITKPQPCCLLLSHSLLEGGNLPHTITRPGWCLNTVVALRNPGLFFIVYST